jgi:hypothetical protein
VPGRTQPGDDGVPPGERGSVCIYWFSEWHQERDNGGRRVQRLQYRPQCLRSSWLLDLSETVSARTGDEIVRPTFLLSRGRWRGLTELVSAAALLHDLGHVTATPWRTSFQSSESMMVSAGRGCSLRAPPPPNFWMFLPVQAIKHSGATHAPRALSDLGSRRSPDKEIGEAV